MCVSCKLQRERAEWLNWLPVGGVLLGTRMAQTHEHKTCCLTGGSLHLGATLHHFIMLYGAPCASLDCTVFPFPVFITTGEF